MDTSAILYATGDLILDEPNAHTFFVPSRELLASADFVLGQIEVPHTLRGEPNSTDIPAPPADPANLDALVPCGFNLCTTAGNHAHDNGVPGIVDTIAHLKERGIAVTGSGRTITEAKTPAVAVKKGITVAVLAYNAVGPREGWATSKKAGVSYVQILTHHEPSPRATPGLPATIYTFPEPDSLAQMQADIRALRPKCDILLVALHKGMVHLDNVIQMYESPLSHAAIDAGADAVIGHHAHILRGIEIYQGKPIYHNLGNFVCVTHALTPTAGNDSPERLAWIASREKMFGFTPDTSMPYYPFNPNSRNTMLAKLVITRQGIQEFGYVPCYINHDGAPVPLTTYEEAQPVISYIQRLQEAEQLPCRMEWQPEGWVRVTSI